MPRKRYVGRRADAVLSPLEESHCLSMSLLDYDRQKIGASDAAKCLRINALLSIEKSWRIQKRKKKPLTGCALRQMQRLGAK